MPAGAHILELGSGVGRMTHPLLERGFTVTAVDESAEMLERVRGARTICGPIEDLDLGETFDVVMLASFLVHTRRPEVRRGVLRTCARHVAAGGCVLIQREGEDYHSELPRERVDPSGFTVRIVSSEPVGGGREHGARGVRVPGRDLDPDVPGPPADEGAVRGGAGGGGVEGGPVSDGGPDMGAGGRLV